MRYTYVTLIGCCLLLLTSPTWAKDKKPKKPMDMQAAMETYTKLATPGEPHKRMADRAGSWSTTTKSWMDPNKPPTESTGACEHTMLLGGRFLRQECTGDMMGQPYTGIGVLGYDNHTRKYVSTWMDSMGTGIFFMEGSAGKDGNTITQKGHYDDPIEGAMKLRAITKLVGADHELFEMFGTGKNGKEMKMMEITYTRKR
ncbi:MAG: DUF1579 domain-containing protein [Nitrospira sp.]|nr:DUF1579 domain-containing protein [Nitrospira sp.]